MSDANSGDESPKRPGMNAERADGGGQDPAQNPPKKKSRRRWKQRHKRSESGIRAENTKPQAPQAGDGVAASANSSTPTANPDAAHTAAGSPAEPAIGTPKNSKRRRRRRNRSRSRSGDARANNQASESAAQVGNAEPSNASGNQPHGKNHSVGDRGDR
ncbi:MAG: hypothetical protein ABJ358_06545, partial [Rhizobiaceae bacterium]